MTDDEFDAALATALGQTPPFMTMGALTIRRRKRANGRITTVDQIEVIGDEHADHYWVKRYARAGDAYKEWSFLAHNVTCAGFALAEPVAYLAAPIDAVLTRHAAGVTMSNAFATPERRHTIEHACAAAGRWLAALHQSGPAAIDDSHPPAAIRSAISARLRRVCWMCALPESFMHEGGTEIDRRLATAPVERLARVRTHGDFGPFNILVHDGGGTIIDPSFEASVDELENRCARDEDVARFLTCIEFASTLDTGERLEASERFLEGYASGGGTLSSAVLNVFRLKYRLQGLLDWWSVPLNDAFRRGPRVVVESWLRG